MFKYILYRNSLNVSRKKSLCNKMIQLIQFTKNIFTVPNEINLTEFKFIINIVVFFTLAFQFTV